MEDLFFSPYSSSSFPRRRPVAASPFDYFSHPYYRPYNHNPRRYQTNYPESYLANYPERYPVSSMANFPKVVSIPVSDNSESLKELEEGKKRRQRERDELAAARIQRVVRGFFVRKNMRIVRRIEGEAEEVAKRIEVEEERIRKEEKERIRVNEMLMGFLFRLDEVRGVREYRRKVIRRVIGLQDRVDSISNSGSGAVLGDSEDFVEKGDSDVILDKNEDVDMSVNMGYCAEKTDAEISVEESNSEVDLEENEDEKTSERMQIEEDPIGYGDESGDLVVSLGEKKNANAENSVEESNSIENRVEKESVDPKLGEFWKGQDAGAEDNEANAVLEEMCEVNEENLCQGNKQVTGESKVQNGISEEQLMEEESSSSSSAAVDRSVNDEMDMNEPNPVAECPEEVLVDDKEDQVIEAADSPVDVARLNVEDGDMSINNSEMKDVMEKVMAESERLQKLVATLCERSAEQCSMMAGLMGRVEQLEQVVQKMDKKKKKRHANNVLSSKCGQKKR